MKWVGDHYTWCNRQDSTSRIWSRIDWALINHQWLLSFLTLYVEALQESLSDHRPLWVKFGRAVQQVRRGFRFCNMQISSPNYTQLVKHEWQRKVVVTKMYLIMKKLRALQQHLKSLHRMQFGDVMQ